ncbi:MAG: hypothetical protein ACLRVU_03395 [Beduini sp.]|uniref:hypothetical protein n=1 Tax=Beduini sp. TaxID=1922300 RepID=UPI00399F829A
MTKAIPTLESFEVIENENGAALKLPNGFMICYHRKYFNLGTFVANGTGFRNTISDPFIFPVPFVDNPTIVTSTANDGDYKYCSVIGVIRNQTKISSVTCSADTSTAGIVTIQYTAFGKWK